MPGAELVGLVPAAGRARRLGPLPCSKEVLPIGVRATADGPVVRVACDCLLDALRMAGVARTVIVLREDKWDVARHLGSGEGRGFPISYLSLADSASLPESLDCAGPFLRGERVALGFPDVQLGPADSLARVAARQEETGSDLVLGLFPAERPETTDMVEVDAAGRVVRIEVRPRETALRLCWLLAVWGPAFTEHLHEVVESARRRDAFEGYAAGELQIGAVVAGALERGLDVRGIEIAGGWFRDIGTPEDLAAVMRQGEGRG
jgi:glucose-1-phosphate thymidylyltransferase